MTPAFRGRSRERQALDRLVEAAREGRSGVLVVRGEAGMGKTALLRLTADQAPGFRTVQVAGVESEMELPFAGLHQLCGPLLGGLGVLPHPQQAALQVAFGLASGAAPDRFLVGLAALTLLAEVARRSRCCVSWTTSSGSTRPPRRRSGSWRAACWLSGSRSSSPSA